MPHDLAWLLGDFSAEAFFASYFETDLLHLGDRGHGCYDAIFSPACLETLIWQ